MPSSLLLFSGPLYPKSLTLMNIYLSGWNSRDRLNWAGYLKLTWISWLHKITMITIYQRLESRPAHKKVMAPSMTCLAAHVNSESSAWRMRWLAVVYVLPVSGPAHSLWCLKMNGMQCYPTSGASANKVESEETFCLVSKNCLKRPRNRFLNSPHLPKILLKVFDLFLGKLPASQKYTPIA